MKKWSKSFFKLSFTEETEGAPQWRPLPAAKSGDAEEARKKLQDAAEELSKAHHYQTELIQNEAGGEKTEMTLLMVHAQDHLMNAMTVKDLAAEIIELYEKITEQRGASI